MNKKNLIICLVILTVLFSFKFFLKQSERKVSDNLENSFEEVKEIHYFEVYVYGGILKPGIYEVPEGWTLANLINVIGLKSQADLKQINYSIKLKEGESYYIPTLSDAKVESNLINLNEASLEELMSLTGIGEKTALRIISYREAKKFQSIEELKEVPGIKDSVFEKIKDLITI